MIALLLLLYYIILNYNYNNNYMHISGGFSKAYNKQGVANFYQKQGHTYSNPHGYDIVRLIRKKLGKTNPYINMHSHILDLACGSGEVTMPLLALGYKNIRATDPYTYEMYEKNTKIKCDRFGFMDILEDCYTAEQQQQQQKQQKQQLKQRDQVAIETDLTNNSNNKYNSKDESSSVRWVFDCIICSYAMHLVKQSMLHDFCNKLAQLSKYLIIISPHKLPAMRDSYGWQQIQACAHDKIHFRAYRSYNYDPLTDNVDESNNSNSSSKIKNIEKKEDQRVKIKDMSQSFLDDEDTEKGKEIVVVKQQHEKVQESNQ